jgi:hypothetical protein
MACPSYKFGEVQRLDRPTVPGPHELPDFSFKSRYHALGQAGGRANERGGGHAALVRKADRRAVLTRQAELSLYTRPMIFCFYLLVVFIETCSQGTTFQFHFRQKFFAPSQQRR